MSRMICDSCGADWGNHWGFLGSAPGEACGQPTVEGWCKGKLVEHEERAQPKIQKLQRLTIEEVVYWLVVAGWDLVATAAVERDLKRLREVRQLSSSYLRKRDAAPAFRREQGFVAFLCGEALHALGADR